MTATTPNKGIPYAQPADARGAGADAMRDLAQRVDDLLTAQDPAGLALGTPTTAQTALADNVWTGVGSLAFYDQQGAGFTYDGSSLTYTGPARWFLVSFGANVAVNGESTTAGAGLRVLFDGSAGWEGNRTGPYGHLGGAIPMRLGAGAYQTVRLEVNANSSMDNGGAHDRAFLRVATLS